MGPRDRRLLRELVDVVGGDHALTAPEEIEPYCVDWTGRFRGTATAVLRPGSTDEVAAVIDVCRRQGVGIVPQGGNTGLVGGGVPADRQVVLSMRRLDAVPDVDARSGQLTAGAGVTLTVLHRSAAAAGWAYGVDFASRDRATVGGTIATNAGGLRVLRHGETRAQVVGAEVVLGNGSVLSHLRGLQRDNTGYHLPSLLCGSEGTLGVVTAARLRLVQRTDERVVVLLAFDALEPAVAAAGALRRDLRSLDAAELFLQDGLALVCDVTGSRPPFDSPHVAYLLVEVADRVSPADELAQALASLPHVVGTVAATDPTARAELWRYREAHTAAVNTVGVPHKLDVALPADRLAEFMGAVPAVVGALAPGASTWLWGHAADGNVHVNVTGVAPDDERLDEGVLALVVELGGTISAEHGIGTAKRAWLGLSRSDREIAAFRAIKHALDPDGILNPNVLLPPPGVIAPVGATPAAPEPAAG